ncbi:hypothetical protein CN490_22515 [Bacillus cereus]|nr:hypothetical protein CN490_22515 [Bacillus cereus]
MSKKTLEYQSYATYKVEVIYRSTGNMKQIKSFEVQSMEQVQHKIDMYKNERYHQGYSLEEIKVSIVLGWQETFWKSQKPETVSDIDKDIASLPNIILHNKPSEKCSPTEAEIRNNIIDSARNMMDMDYVRQVNEAFDD